MVVDWTGMHGCVCRLTAAVFWMYLFSGCNYAVARDLKGTACGRSEGDVESILIGPSVKVEGLPRLAGTVVMSDCKTAIFVPDGTSTGGSVLGVEGETLGGRLILEIRPGQAVLRGPEGITVLNTSLAVEIAKSVQPARINSYPESLPRVPGTRGSRYGDGRFRD